MAVWAQKQKYLTCLAPRRFDARQQRRRLLSRWYDPCAVADRVAGVQYDHIACPKAAGHFGELAVAMIDVHHGRDGASSLTRYTAQSEP